MSPHAVAQSPWGRFKAHPLELALHVFGEVRPGEAVTVLLMTANALLIMTAYYLLKVAREPLILLGGGAEVKSYSAAGQAILLVFVTNLYGWIAGRVPRLQLIGYVTAFFASNLILFAVLGAHGVALGVPFFLWVGIFNLVTITQFWSFAADTYTEEQGKRLFPIIGIGSSVGAVGGAAIASRLMRGGSPFRLMVVAAVILVSTLAITYMIHRRQVYDAASARGPHHDEPVGGSNAFSLVAHDRYLIVIAALVLLLNICTKTGDYVLDRMLISHAAALGTSKSAYIGEFKARYFEWINVLEIVLQSLIVSRVIKYAGMRAALMVVPLVSVIGYTMALVSPVITVLFVTRIAESTLDYSLSNTTRQALWLVTTREAKYKAKQVLDSFVCRVGDSLSAVIVWTGSHLDASLRWFLVVNVCVAVAWVVIAALTGREYLRRERSSAPAAAPAH